MFSHGTAIQKLKRFVALMIFALCATSFLAPRAFAGGGAAKGPLEVRISGPSTAKLGDIVEYTVMVKNPQAGGQWNVSTSVSQTGGLQFLSHDSRVCSSGWGVSCFWNDVPDWWSHIFRIRYKVSGACGSDVIVQVDASAKNTGSVWAKTHTTILCDQPTPTPVATATHTPQPVVVATATPTPVVPQNNQLVVTKTCNGSIFRGGIVGYTVTVRNVSGSVVAPVSLIDIVPDGYTVFSAPYLGDLWSQGCAWYPGHPTTIVCGPLVLQPGEFRQFFFFFRVKSWLACGSTVVNRVEVSCAGASSASATAVSTVFCY